MTGCVFNIQKFSIHDGPGIRTTVFLKGCNLRCKWCHNPESHVMPPQLETDFDKCIGCGKCFKTCPENCHTIDGNGRSFNRKSCKGCGKCAEICYSGALKLIGKYMNSHEVLKEVLADIDFYRESGGGVTFSGGEPLLQMDFLLECLQLCKENGINTAVDTAGDVPFDWFLKINPYVDLYLYDIKTLENALHIEYTDAYNERILENVASLCEIAKEIRIRIPIIPEFNDNENAISEIVDFVKKLNSKNITHIDLNPFHRMGLSKYQALGMTYFYKDVKTQDKAHTDRLQNLIHLN